MEINNLKKLNGVHDNRNELLQAVANELNLIVMKDWVISGTTNIISNKEKNLKLEIKASKKDGNFIIKEIVIRYYENGIKETYTGLEAYKLVKGEYIKTF